MKLWFRKLIYLCAGMAIFPLVNIEANPLSLPEGVSEKLVVLRGKLISKIFPGPPEYSSIEEGDRADHCWVLQLDQRSTEIAIITPVVEPANEVDFIRECSNLNQVFLSLNEDQIDLCRELVNTEVAVEGYLFHAHTIHHYTPILMDVKRVVK